MFSRADHGPEQGWRARTASLVDGRRRVIVAAVRPELDGGRFPVKRVVGDVLDVEADLLVDGHDVLAARLLYRHERESALERAAARSARPQLTAGTPRCRCRARPLAATPSSRGSTSGPASSGASGARSTRSRTSRVELLGAAELLRAAVERAAESIARSRRRAPRSATPPPLVADVSADAAERAALVLDPALSRGRGAPSRSPLRRRATAACSRSSSIRCARASRRWYELFPRSTAAARRPARHLRRRRARLAYVAELGFDVVYLPPIHPIGRTHRKGPNNALDAGPRRRRQPVGHRRRRRRPQGDPSRARHARRLPPLRRARARARPRGRARHRLSGVARSSVRARASRVVRAPRRRHRSNTPRIRRRNTRTSTRSTSTAPIGARCGTS